MLIHYLKFTANRLGRSLTRIKKKKKHIHMGKNVVKTDNFFSLLFVTNLITFSNATKRVS